MADRPDAGRLRGASDPAAPQERTTLAWRRTGLALVVGSLTIGRLTFTALGPVVLVPTVLGAALAGWVVVVSLGSRPTTRRTTRLQAGGSTFSVLADGRLPATVAALVAGLAGGELLAAVVDLL